MKPKAKRLIETLAKTLRVAQTKTHCHPLLNVKTDAISLTVGEVKGSKVVYTWADTVSRMEIRTLDYTVGQLEAEALINTPSKALG